MRDRESIKVMGSGMILDKDMMVKNKIQLDGFISDQTPSNFQVKLVFKKLIQTAFKNGLGLCAKGLDIIKE